MHYENFFIMKKAFLRKNDEGEEIPTFILQMAHTYI
jgi:hypothetical protein